MSDHTITESDGSNPPANPEESQEEEDSYDSEQDDDSESEEVERRGAGHSRSHAKRKKKLTSRKLWKPEVSSRMALRFVGRKMTP